jgi:hypothetical protein
MKKSEIKKGMMVIDRDFGYLGVGLVTKVMKTRVVIDFPGFKGLTKYDTAHCQFLVKMKK